jgi:proteasome accessory factor A
MDRVLCGIETEYGIALEGRGASTQIEDSKHFVRSYPGEVLSLWDYRHESPRNDLRGFRLDQLAFDPVDAKFDAGEVRGLDSDTRSDRILTNGARFYNDHGHPEFSTPEAWCAAGLTREDALGEQVLLETARAYAATTGLRTQVYKNNTDFHGASYGTHESYLCPRALGFDRLFAAVTPILVARVAYTGAGKAGAEEGAAIPFQASQRADFFVESANAETLYRRPIFNTRDEPHSDPAHWIRLHVIAGDANMNPWSTWLKVSLVQVAIQLEKIRRMPRYAIKDPVQAAKQVSRSLEADARIELDGGRWTTVDAILDSTLGAASQFLGGEFAEVIEFWSDLRGDLRADWTRAIDRVDWCAKRYVIESAEPESIPAAQAIDLEYCNIDPEEGLYHALEQMGEIRPFTPEPVPGLTRAALRGHAAKHFPSHLVAACWRSLTFRREQGTLEIELRPDVEVPPSIFEILDVESFIETLLELKSWNPTD